MSGRFLTRLGNGLFGNASAQASALLVQLVVALVSVPVFATVWGLEDYGVWLILVTVPATIALSDLGFIGAVGNAMTAAVARGQDAGAREMFGQLTALAFWVGLGLLSLVAIIGFGIDPPWLDFADGATGGQGGGTILALASFAVFSLWSRTLYAALRATGHFAKGSYATAFAALLDITLAGTIALAGGGLLGAAIGYACGQAIGLAIMARLVAKLAPGFRPALMPLAFGLLRPLLRPALALVMTILAQSVILQGAVVILGIVAGSAAVPAFTAVRTLARIGVQLVGVANLAIMPEMTMARARTDGERIADLAALNVCAGIVIALPAALGLALFGPAIVDLWSGGVIAASQELCTIMALATVLGCLWGPFAAFLTADNLQGRYALWFLVAACSGAVAVYPLAERMGAAGAALATVAVELAVLIAAGLAAWRAGFLVGLNPREILDRTHRLLRKAVESR